MFCPLEQIELKVGTCPIQKCIYRDSNGSCLHDTLAAEQVEAKVIAELKHLKVYVARSKIQEARERIMIGAILIRYSEFIKDSWPDLEAKVVKKTVNTGTVKIKTPTDEGLLKPSTADILSQVFGLTATQQQKFLSQTRISEWAARQDLTLDLNKVREILRSIPTQALKEV